MNIFQTCKETSDAIELFAPQCLYLKPIARLNISVQLPQIKVPGKTISNWEVMEKLKGMIKPEEFTVLRVSKSTLEFIRFEAEIENKSKLSSVISRLDTRTIKLSGFSELLKVRAAEAKIPFPTRHTWDSYFRDAKNMNEMKPGERPDTIHISNLPCKWFLAKQDKTKGGELPSEYVFKKVFEVFGEVRCVDIPIIDPYRNKMKLQVGMKTFSFGQDHSFEGYVQFKEYICFVKAMDALRGMKLLYKDGDKAYTASIKVDFDKTKHLSDLSIHQRRVERERFIALEKEKEEVKKKEKEVEEKRKEEDKQHKLEERKQKAERRKKREEKRKLKELKKLKEQEDHEMSLKIAVEERKLLHAQRKLESIRLLDELFERVKIMQQRELERKKQEDKRASKGKEKEEDKERELRNRLVKKYKTAQEEQREKLQRTIKLRSVLASTSKAQSSVSSSSSSSSESEPVVASVAGRRETSWKEKQDFDGKQYHVVSHYKDKHWYPNKQLYEDSQSYTYPYDDLGCPPPRMRYQHRGAFYPRRRGFYFPRWKRYPRQGNFQSFNPHRLHDGSLYYYDEYYRYFQKLAKGRNVSESSSRSRSRSYSRSRSRSFSRSWSAHGSRTCSMSKSKSSSHSPVRSSNSTHKVVKESDSEVEKEGERKQGAKHSQKKKKKKHKKEVKSSDAKKSEKKSKRKHEKEH